MAIYNEILSARFARAIQKLFSMKGSPPMKQLSGELMPIHAFASGVENRYLEGWSKFGISVFLLGGGAGNLSRMRIRNPVGSNVVAVIEQVEIGVTVADQPFMYSGAQTADLPTVVSLTSARLDPRGNPNPVCIVSTTNASPGAIFGIGKFQTPLGNNSFAFLIQDDVQALPLLPGDAYEMSANTANQTLLTSYLWRERPLEESERS